MIRFFRRNIKFSNPLCLKMDSDEDMLHYSHQKLSSLIRDSDDKFEAIKEYLKKLRFQSIKDFPSDLEWFNVSEPLSFTNHLKGKIVVLDFFTYCCINCMHIIPDLREIEQEFSVEDGLVVIGVHSAKFDNEKVSSNILAAVQRYNITHPVVNDANSFMWKNCDVHCWPTLLILGPNANPIVMLMGEGHKKNLQLYIRTCLEFYKAKNQISNHKIPFKSAYHLLPDLKGPLLFPGKITCFNENLIALSDTGNHRILIIDSKGVILHEIGGNKEGFKDGNFAKAEFNAPQGLIFKDATILFVADTENHAIRKIDLNKKTVETIIGTGKQGHDKVGGKKWSEQEISSPWDLCLFETPDMDMTFYPNGNPPLKDVLIIAMAGTHQIWALFFEDTVWWKCKKYTAGTCISIAGSGREENRNNSYPQNAAFAQPSGLALCKQSKEVYIADSESSCVRRLSLADGKVTAVVGGDRNPNNLFAFGDKDGTLYDAKLQHLLGLAFANDDSTLFVADTYNHKLKKVNVKENSIGSLSGVAKTIKWKEPAGLCVLPNGTKLYVADTNNHCIRVLVLGSNFTVKSHTKLDLHLKTEKSSSLSSSLKRNKYHLLETTGISINVKGGKMILSGNFKFEDGLSLTAGSPQSWIVDLPKATWSCVPINGLDLDNFDVVLSIPEGQINDKVDIVFKIVTCNENACLPKEFIVRIPVLYNKDSPTSINYKFNVLLKPNIIKLV